MADSSSQHEESLHKTQSVVQALCIDNSLRKPPTLPKRKPVPPPKSKKPDVTALIGPVKKTPEVPPRVSSSTNVASLSRRTKTDELLVYPSYCRYTGVSQKPFEVYVAGWLYQPFSNRKGRLMMMALEQFVGTPARAEPQEPLTESLISVDSTPLSQQSPQAEQCDHKALLRERMSAILHKGVSDRELVLTFQKKDGSKWTQNYVRTDESGFFMWYEELTFIPEVVSVVYGRTVHTVDCLYVPENGITVISDIDDTLRHTGVPGTKREVLQNVLMKTFDQVRIEGVAEWYQHMARQGVIFHYVSNSPWLLYKPIEEYLQHHEFPKGTIHLKKYQGLLDGVWESAHLRKRVVLQRLVREFPRRKFLLVGDSGEADLEAYCELARKFPDRILSIYIRDITLPASEPLSDYDAPPRHSRSASDTSTTRGRLSTRDLIDLSSPSVSRSPSTSACTNRPLRPAFMRRTSSKINVAAHVAADSMADAASVVSSVARSAAHKIMAPQLPPRPGTVAGGSVDPKASAQRRCIRNSPSLGLHARSRSSSRTRSDVRAANFVTVDSEPEERRDRVVDEWKTRVWQQRQMLPPHVKLQMWRKPADVEPESLRLIAEHSLGRKSSII